MVSDPVTVALSSTPAAGQMSQHQVRVYTRAYIRKGASFCKINSGLAVQDANIRGSLMMLLASSALERQQVAVGPLHLLDDFEAALGQVPDCCAQ